MKNLPRLSLSILAMLFIIATQNARAAEKPALVPAATIVLPDGKAYTAAEIVQAFSQAQARITELQQERGDLAGQIIDLNTQVKALQDQLKKLMPVTPTPAK